jgi:ribosomal protein S8
MKINVSTSIINNNQKIEPNFDNIFKIFKNIKFFFGDQMIEELNELNYNIYYNLYINDDERKKFDNLTKIRLFKNIKWEVYFPLIFWFNNKPGLSIPLLSLQNIDLRLEYELNNLEYILNLDSTFNLPLVKPIIKINLINDVILLDTEERKLFGSYSHEYIIERFISYSNVFIKDISMNVSKKLNNLIKDIYIITKPINNSNENYYKTVINDYDDKYYRYTQAIYYYNEFIKYNYYTSLEQNNYIEDIQIIKNILLDVNNFINTIDINIYYTYFIKNNNVLIDVNIINNINIKLNLFHQIDRICKNFNINLNINLELLKLIMFIENKYYSNLPDSKKNYLLHIYLKYQHKNNQIINKISPIEKMSIKINGVDNVYRLSIKLRSESIGSIALVSIKGNEFSTIGY